ncbi:MULTISPECIES: hypothetical protein [Sphingobacterium]|uniref:hypothetical protein n=1 Tax=Sphingobacterium TaxID=28453 RepID=UPI0013DAF35B|nr:MULTISPECIES: hypothetical protein [unclassified Sphingobacterium]
MATMYSLFFGILFTVVCSIEGDRSGILDFLFSLKPRGAHLYSLMNKDANKSRTWTLGRYQVPRLSGTEDNNKNQTLRPSIIAIASAEIGVKEATGNNDGKRVEEYLRYTDLGKGYDWCASFVSWCYGQAGLKEPCNPWSPALFPKARVYWKQGKLLTTDRSSRRRQLTGPLRSEFPILGTGGTQHDEDRVAANVFGIYGAKAKRINHVGLVKQASGDYLVSIEGNSNNRVESRRRHLRTVHALADWVDE